VRGSGDVRLAGDDEVLDDDVDEDRVDDVAAARLPAMRVCAAA
jgi:hypothetical protein